MAYHLSSSRTYPVELADAYARLLPMPLTDLMSQRYALIPPVREIRGQEGVWGSVGQTRTIVLADGGTMLETLVDLDPPRSFEYVLEDLTGPLKPLATRIRGRWALEPVGTGVRVTWSWDVEPRGRLGALAERPFRRLWDGFARQTLARLESALVG